MTNKKKSNGRPPAQAKPQPQGAAPAEAKVRIFVPRDAAALSMGANAVAESIAAEAKKRNAKIEIVRNGSRGMLWLEPLVEVETEKGRVAYGPVAAGDVAGLFEASFLTGGNHKLRHGLTDEIPYFKNQERLTFARCGITDPLSIADYRAHGGFAGLTKAIAMEPADIVAEVTPRGCAAAAARVSRPASNGRRSWIPGPSRNTSAATRMKATAAPSPTAC